MIENNLQHLVIARHGEGEGDTRRAKARKGIHDKPTKATFEEELTKNGIRQSELGGKWVAKFILEAYGLESFDKCLTSPAIRARQTAEALGASSNWIVDDLLNERDRGEISGWPRQAHETIYPDSYEQMITDPLHWVPPGGESIISVTRRASILIANLKRYRSVMLSTHRDWLWASLIPLEGLSEAALADVDTDAIENGQIVHYTSIDPNTRNIGKELIWKRIINPWSSKSDVESASNTWVEIPLAKNLG